MSTSRLCEATTPAASGRDCVPAALARMVSPPPASHRTLKIKELRVAVPVEKSLPETAVETLLSKILLHAMLACSRITYIYRRRFC